MVKDTEMVTAASIADDQIRQLYRRDLISLDCACDALSTGYGRSNHDNARSFCARAWATISTTKGAAS